LSLRRSSSLRHGRRVLVASGLTAAMLGVPSLAMADDSAPGSPAPDPAALLQQLDDGLSASDADGDGAGGTPTIPGAGGTPTIPGAGGTPTIPGAGGTPTIPGAGGTPTIPGAGGGGATPGGDTLPEPTRLEAPDDLLEALKQATRAAGIPDSCVDGIAEGFELIVNGLLDPAQLEAIIDELTGLLEEFEGGLEGVTGGSGSLPDLGLLAADAESMDEDVAPEEDPGGDVVAGLELIGTTLAEDCMPETDQGGTPTVPVDNGTDGPPVAEHPAPVQQAPVAQPVSYPGYAPTGADSARADDVSVPLTALGGGLVLVAAGAAGYGMRGRAVRTRD